MRIFVYGSLLIPEEAARYHDARYPVAYYTLRGARRVFARVLSDGTSVLDLDLNVPGEVPGRVIVVRDAGALASLRAREEGYTLIDLGKGLWTFSTPRGSAFRDGRRSINARYLRRVLAGLPDEAARREFLATTWHRGSFLAPGARP